MKGGRSLFRCHVVRFNDEEKYAWSIAKDWNVYDGTKGQREPESCAFLYVQIVVIYACLTPIRALHPVFISMSCVADHERLHSRLNLLYSDTLSRVMWNFSSLGILESCLGVNKWSKEASIPMPFSAVIFESSKSSLNGLKQLSGSDIRHHVLSWHTLLQRYPNLILWTVLSFRYDRTNSWIEISIGVVLVWTVHPLVTTLTGWSRTMVFCLMLAHHIP